MHPLFRRPAALVPLVLAACLDPAPVPESNYGVIGLDAVVTPVDTLLEPQAIFYRSQQLVLPSSRLSDDGCAVAGYSSEGDEGPLPRFLDAGESVTVSTATDTRFLVPTVEGNRELYALPFGETMPFRPGEAVTVAVPGAPGGFANGTISVLTAHSFTLETVTSQPPEDSTLKLRWSPAGDDSTKMLVQLRYGVSQPEQNQQIFCELIDDGEHNIPAVLVTQWRSTETVSREINAARLRVAARLVEDGVLVAVSAFEVEGTVD